MFSKEEGDERARFWNIIEEIGQAIGVIDKNQTISNNDYNPLGEEEYQKDAIIYYNR